MANYTQVADLAADALFRSGEPATGGTYATRVYEYLNRVQHDLLLGGGVAAGRDLATSAGLPAHLVYIPMTDWWWARKQPRGVLTTDALIEVGTVTATQGSPTLTFSSAPPASVAGWRVYILALPTVPRILSHAAGSTTATMDAPWPEITQTSAQYILYNLEYQLPADFLRFAGEPFLHSMYQDVIPVSSREQHDYEYPPRTLFREPPTAACMIQPQRIQINAFDTRQYRLEFDYIFMPPELQAGGKTILPAHHSVVLSVGAAMLIAFDKSDDKADNLASEYRELVSRLVQEHRRQLSAASMTYGVHKTRRGQGGKGRIQPRGEQFLV